MPIPRSATALLLMLGVVGGGASAVIGCADDVPSNDEVGADEAALDYRATNGREFAVTAELAVTLEAAPADLATPSTPAIGPPTPRRTDDASETQDEDEDEEARLARASELARDAIDRTTRALDAELSRIWPEDRRKAEKNVVAMIRMATPGRDELVRDGDTYRFTYRAEIAGPNDLLDRLPLDRSATRPSTTLTVGDETVVLSWEPTAETGDAYPSYAEMFEGGLDIAIHVGGDHYNPRNDIREYEALYAELLQLGLRSPVKRAADLKLDSGPFKGTMRVAGKNVEVRATLVHADMAPDDRLSDLVDAFKHAASTADVVIYRGHAGPSVSYSGVVVHYNPRVAIPATSFRDLDLPSKYQLFVFDGCETYTGYADQIYEHPKKDTRNADVITSVSYASALVRAESLRSLLRGIVGERNKAWKPKSWDALITDMNKVQRGPWTSIYGVHGLADNPQISMLADPARIGASCRTSTNCGAADSLCVSLPSIGRVCGAACTGDAGCPGGTTCRPVNSPLLGAVKQCLPTP